MTPPRYTVRVPQALADALEAAVRPGQTVSDILRVALENYLASPPPLTLSDNMSDTMADVSDTTRSLSDMLSDIADIQARLTHLEQQMEGVVAGVRQRPTRPTPPPPAATRPPRTPSDVDAAYQRMRVLQREGFSLTQIATQLDLEGFRTRQGRPWHKSTVSYVLRTHGR
jgi:hypothetical protein